ncbi:MAG: transcription termination/antitermination NusG family protein [Chthoniobacteraceae bacterium]
MSARSVNIPNSNVVTGFHWYCLRSQPKHEHIAAAHLRILNDVDVYCPRIRVQRMTRRGLVWFTDALFPGYLFCRFDRVISQKAVTYASGVSGIVRFGADLAVAPDTVIAELRSHFSGESVHTVVVPEIKEGDSVVITEGPFLGIKTLVTQAVPALDRVRILLDILGEAREVVIERRHLFKETVAVLESPKPY